MSDDTDHGASAIYASLEPISKSFVDAGKKAITLISDSPLPQYRKKSVFWMIKKFAKENKVTVKWIYLEVGHGKGIPDGLGAVLKRMIKAIVDMSPGIPIYTVDDLLQHGLQDMVPSIKLVTFSTSDILEKKKQIPTKLTRVPGTLQIHEVIAKMEGREVKLYASNLSGEVMKLIKV